MIRKPEITFKLGRIEDLSDKEREKVEGLTPEMKQGLVIKEYSSGSFVKLRRFLPLNNSLTAEIRKELSVGDRKIITQAINTSLSV